MAMIAHSSRLRRNLRPEIDGNFDIFLLCDGSISTTVPGSLEIFAVDDGCDCLSSRPTRACAAIRAHIAGDARTYTVSVAQSARGAAAPLPVGGLRAVKEANGDDVGGPLCAAW